ncbi:hypothetical protein GTY80_40170, partial [Amycolatopsis sp. SID8362]|nr:hypothetical protein [Amycolatopsis sp. SID8362]NED46135.1 hypothetical protein [Amycolatopsis sp. SID8362]
MSSDDTRWQLTGVELHDLEPELCLLITPNGGQYSITAPVAGFRAWLARCDGTRTRAELLAGMSPDHAEVLDVLEADGCLHPAIGDDGARRLAATTVLVTGAPELTGPLVEALGASGYGAVHPLAGTDIPVAAADTVLVAAYTHPAHRQLTALDALCAEHGVRFFPFRVERGQGIAGPAVEPGFGPDFADALARRRSAA